jgi:putative two-component system response regulator
MSSPSSEKLARALGGVLRFSPHLDVLMRICTYIEAQEETSGLHVYRMVAYSIQLGRELGVPPHSLEQLALAASLHDVGKLQVPARILLKPGKLEPEQWEVMTTHTVAGSRLLEGSGFEEIQQSSQVALCHHEKYDGSGYPSGLVGASIPLFARIVAVADVFDALTTDRPYKQAYPMETAVGMVREGAGSHFDPDVVEAFTGCEGRIRSLRDLFEEVGTDIPLYRFAEFMEGRR